jgi:ribosomal protein S27AE
VPTKRYDRVCSECGADFVAHNARRVYCDKKCGDRAYSAAQRATRTPKKPNGGWSGYTAYGPDELLYRPYEQQVEMLNVYQLAEAWGVNKMSAATMKERPWECVDGPLEITDERRGQVREWLRVQVENLGKT